METGAARGRLGAMPERIADHPVAQLEWALRHLRLDSANEALDAALAARGPSAFLREIGDPLVRRLSDDDAATRIATALIEQHVARSHPRLVGDSRTARGARLRPVGASGRSACSRSGSRLAERRCRIAYLGSYTPARVLRDYAAESPCAVVVLSAEREQLAPADRRELAAITRPLVVVGAARERLARMLGAPAVAPGTAAVDIARTARTSSVVQPVRFQATAATR